MSRTKGLLSWLPVVAVGGLLVAGVGGYRLMNGKCPLTGCDMCTDKASATTVADDHGGCCPLSAGTDATLVAVHADGQCPHSTTECTLSKEECAASCDAACQEACEKNASECPMTCEEKTEQAQAEATEDKPAEPIGG